MCLRDMFPQIHRYKGNTAMLLRLCISCQEHLDKLCFAKQASNIEPTQNITSAKLYIIRETLQASPIRELNKNVK